MPVIAPRDMNGYEYDRGPLRTSNAMAKPRYDPYRDDYSHGERVDPYRRDDDDMYSRGQNRPRFGGDYIDQAIDMRNTSDPSFELDHLATFAAWTRDGFIQPEDGLLKLRQMENTTGIWTMRCLLVVEKKFLIILDNQSGEELEKFPIQSVHTPTAIFNNDTREIYNNLLLFTVGEDPKKRTQADMHIFQSVDTASQKIVDEILLAQKGEPKGHRIPPAPIQAPPRPSERDMYDFNGMKDYLHSQRGSRYYGPGPDANRSIKVKSAYRDEFEPGQNEVLERDVQLLNHCFDDIEKFVSRLQQAAETFKELEKRKASNTRDRKRQSGEGIMGYRARPPPSQDFTDIFQKFKLSFNLLAKLKAHIHDPNAPELVHFLFTPLSLIYEASRDPIHGRVNLADSAVAPLITADAKQLLQNCLTSKEIELWRALGTYWTTCKEDWKGYVPNYTPRFYDGWQPAQMHENGFRHSEMDAPVKHRYDDDRSLTYAPFSQDRGDDRYGNYGDYHQQKEYEPSRSRVLAPPSPRLAPRDYRERMEPHHSLSGPENDNAKYISDLRSSGHRVYEVIHDREGRNSKEISLSKGDIVALLDDSRNWWKVRNIAGKVGFAPYTILKEIKDD